MSRSSTDHLLEVRGQLDQLKFQISLFLMGEDQIALTTTTATTTTMIMMIKMMMSERPQCSRKVRISCRQKIYIVSSTLSFDRNLFEANCWLGFRLTMDEELWMDHHQLSFILMTTSCNNTAVERMPCEVVVSNPVRCEALISHLLKNVSLNMPPVEVHHFYCSLLTFMCSCAAREDA